MKNLAVALLAALLGLVASCGDAVGPSGDVVGGSCVYHQDCAGGSICLAQKEFPGGTCSVACNVDDDCPPGSVCIDKQGGVCLLSCAYPQDCRPGYTCKGEDRRGGPGEALVCINH